MRFPKLNPEPTGFAEANTQQDFVNILDGDVIKPLMALEVTLKVLALAVVPVLILEPPEENDKSDKTCG